MPNDTLTAKRSRDLIWNECDWCDLPAAHCPDPSGHAQLAAKAVPAGPRPLTTVHPARDFTARIEAAGRCGYCGTDCDTRFDCARLSASREQSWRDVPTFYRTLAVAR